MYHPHHFLSQIKQMNQRTSEKDHVAATANYELTM